MYVLLGSLLYCLFFNINSVSGTTSSGKEYIIAFMKNIKRQEKLELFITSSSSSKARVEITAPNFPVVQLNETFDLEFGDVKYLQIDVRLMVVGSNRTNQTIFVTSDYPIVIYGLNKEPFTTDGFLQLPTNALGKKYFVVSAKNIRSGMTEFLVVGTYDFTSVTISLSSKIGRYKVVYEGKEFKSDDKFTITLNRHECVQIQSRGDLTGTMVVADKAVGVYSGNDIAFVGPGAGDHLVEMLPSVDKWGRTFVTTPLPERKIGDYFLIISSEDNTRVTITGECDDNTTLAKAGDTYETIINSTDHCYIEADKAILVMQFSQGNNNHDRSDPGDPSMMLVQPIESYISAVSFTVPKGAGVNYTNYLMITIESKHKSGLSLDGHQLQTPFHDIGGTLYSATYIQLSEGSHVLKHKYPNVGFASYLYGRGKYESYLFPVGMRMASVNTKCEPSSMVPGDDKDNDCDGKIDEELCTNSEDDDNDGEVNEDCARTSDAFEITHEEVSTDGSVSDSYTFLSSAKIYQHNTGENPIKNAFEITQEEISTDGSVSDSYTFLSSVKNYQHNTEENPIKNDQVIIHFLPPWFPYLEVAIVSSVMLILTGSLCCCCRKCCLALKRKDNDDDEDKNKPWRKGREPPTKRPPRVIA